MKERTIYIPADSEDYTGYTTNILMGTSTSDTIHLHIDGRQSIHEFDQAAEEQAKEYTFPESREERFLDQKSTGVLQEKGL